MSPLSIALVHHPVLGREGDTITTAITNLDLHDLARSARTYDVANVFVVHPVEAQRELAQRVRSHWVGGAGAKRIPSREEALGRLVVVPSLEDVHAALGGRAALEIWTTAARASAAGVSSYDEARARLEAGEKHVVLVFGTGWGLAASVLADAEVRLEPISGPPSSGYNHLSVRAACAISLDRLRAPRRP